MVVLGRVVGDNHGSLGWVNDGNFGHEGIEKGNLGQRLERIAKVNSLRFVSISVC